VAFRGAPKRPVLLGVWSPGCEVCAQTIGALAAAPALLAAADFDVVYLGLQAGSEQAVAALRFRELLGEDVAAAAILRQRPASSDVRQALAAVLAAVLGRGELTTPGAFLIDAEGRLQVCYFGPIEVEQLVGDVERFGRAKAADNRRSHRGGSWAFYVPRAWQPVVAAFAQRGLPRDAGFYARLRDR
ncbi:MAG: hypothetical protein KDE27_15955, partial [Planctomycetes bacterium]|nr:hypothetical protein [Planctomycetota bacterium]